MTHRIIFNLTFALIWFVVMRYIGKSWDFALFLATVSFVAGFAFSLFLEAKQ